MTGHLSRDEASASGDIGVKGWVTRILIHFLICVQHVSRCQFPVKNTREHSVVGTSNL